MKFQIPFFAFATAQIANDQDSGYLRGNVSAKGGVDQQRLTDLEATNRDWSVCDQFPCQGYLHQDQTPSEYKMIGNNVKRVWEEFGVKGEGVRFFIAEFYGLIDTEHPELSHINPHLINKETSLKERKNNAAGIIFAKHDSLHIEGIAPAVDVVDAEIYNDGRTYQEIYDYAQAGDIVMFNDCFSLPASEKEQANEADPHCAKFGCDYSYPVTFIPNHNKWINMLTEKGVTCIVAACDGGSDLGNEFWRTSYSVDSRGEQKAVMVTAWDSANDRGLATSNYVSDPVDASSDDGFVKIQFANWGNNVITTSVDSESGYVSDFYGTQAATSITGGVFALVQSAAAKYLNRMLCPEELTDLIYKTGSLVGYDAGHPETSVKVPTGLRIPDAYAAVSKIISMVEGPVCHGLRK